MERSEDGMIAVTVEAALPFEPAKIWDAFKQPERWWGREARVDFKKGGRYEVQLQGGAWMKGKIAALSKSRLEVSIPFDMPNVSIGTTLSIELTPDGAKTKIAIRHSGPEVMSWMGELRTLEKGWRETLVRLLNFLKGV
jgi:uncharacterized protein YndB with AHSA1/START domain